MLQGLISGQSGKGLIVEVFHQPSSFLKKKKRKNAETTLWGAEDTASTICRNVADRDTRLVSPVDSVLRQERPSSALEGLMPQQTLVTSRSFFCFFPFFFT